MKNKSLISSFNNAINGVVYAIRTQRNLKIHSIAAVLVLVISLFYDLKKAELVGLFITITLVIFAEMLNTAVEVIVDIIVDEYHPKAKIVKDVAAGAVLVTAFNAVLVGYLIFFDRIEPTASNILNKISNTPMHMVFVGLIVTVITVFMIKAYNRKGTPLQGGMPSGHAAVSFAILTAIWLLAKDIMVFVLALVLSLLVVQSRVEAKIHNVFEVVVGALIGVLIILMLFQLVNIQFLVPGS